MWFAPRPRGARPRSPRVRSVAFCTVERLETRALLSANVLTYHNDPASTGQNLSETKLTPASVTVGTFGKRFSTPLDGQVYAQPLYVSNLDMGALGMHNAVFVATEHDSVYAIDGDSGQVLWHDSFINPTAGVTSVPDAITLSQNIAPEIGITGTPVIDPATNSLFVAAKTQEIHNGDTTHPHFVYTLHKLDITTGADTSTVIADTTYAGGAYTYNSGPYTLGKGDGFITVGGQNRVYFNALRELNRPGLTLNNGVVYIAFGSHGDNGPYHGWVLGYDENTLANTAALNTTPNAGLAGIWQGGGTLATDAQGNMYFETGNGGFDTTLNAQGFPRLGDYGDSFIKIAADPTTSITNQNINGFGLKVVDYFTPFNQQALTNADQDLGSGAPIVLPDSVGSPTHPHLLLGSGKEGKLYLIDRDNMGHFNPTTDHVVQEQGGAINGSLDTPAYYNGQIYYVGGYTDTAKTFSIANAAFSAAPTSVSADSFLFPGSTPSISANGNTNGIVWDIDHGSNQLRAYDATSYAKELWTSAQAGTRDQLGATVKFTLPTVADGHVYVGTNTALVAYGPPVPPTTTPPAPTNLVATAASGVQINLTWQDNSNNEDGFYIEESTDGGQTFNQIGTASVNQQTFAVTGLQVSTAYSFRVRAYNSLGPSPYSNVATATTQSQLPAVDFSSGFANAGTQITLNGSAKLNGSRVELTDGNGNEAGSAFTSGKVEIDRFSTSFIFQLSNAGADGMTFTIQGVGPKAVGGGGGALGYAGINNSVAVTFDLYDNTGEGDDSTNLFTNGANPSSPTGATDLSLSNVDLHSGDPMRVDMTYDGTRLQVTITDTLSNASATQTYTVNIPAIVGGAQAYVGFTGGTGGLTAIQDILSWTLTPSASVPPAAASNLQVTPASGTQLNLSWADNSFTEAGFKILRKTGAAGTYAQVAEVGANTTAYMDAGLTPNTDYYYEAVATNAAGDAAPSNEVHAVTPVPPQTPTNLHTTLVTANEVDLAWQDNATNEIGYRIYRAVPGTDFSQIATLPPNTTAYTDFNRQPGTQYDYHVQAYNIAGYSDFAGITLVTAPAAPAQVVAVAGDRAVQLTWSPVTGAETYSVYRGTAAGLERPTPIASGLTSPSFQDTKLAIGTTYYYLVVAVNASGQSSPSGEASATVPQPGDANGDGAVNFSDLLILAQNYGKTTGATYSTGDFNADGKVDFADLLILAQNYQASTAAALTAATKVLSRQSSK